MPQTQTLDRQLGGLYAKSDSGQPLAFPLKQTEVQVIITGHLSRVDVVQHFENPFETPLEAVYIFPLPDQAAVDAMDLKIGNRRIQGRIKKRQEAQQIYQQAKQQGHLAGLLEQERDNIFTQSLANIQPGETIEVTIRYTDVLKFEGGDYEFIFPMVVGPRYIPGTSIEGTVRGGTAPAPLTQNQDTDLVPDASRLNAPLLPVGMRSGHNIGVTITLDAGVPVHNIYSPSHQIQVMQEGDRVSIRLSPLDTIPNKDLILRYQVAGATTQATVLTQADHRGGHFAAYLIPALQYQPDQLIPKDVVFLIDTSGSQQGDPLSKCQELMRQFINGLNPHDTFSIIDFSDTTQQLSPVPLANTPNHRSRAIRYINRLNASGGTELLRGIQAVLNFPVVQPGRLRSIVLLTDGYIGNENQILAEVQRQLQPGNRLYSFGVGSSVNRFLLNRIAEIGRGVSFIIRQDEPTAAVVEKFWRQMNNPVLTNIQLVWEGAGDPPILYPAVAPDLFAEQPLILFGRKGDRQGGKLHITGLTAGGHPYQQTFSLQFELSDNPAIAQLWGRAQIKHLMTSMVSGDTKVGVEAVTDTALTYQLLSQYTAFVAVSDEVRVNPESDSVSLQVPVEMPQGVSYGGVFANLAAQFQPASQMTSVQLPESVTSFARTRVAHSSLQSSPTIADPEFQTLPSPTAPASLNSSPGAATFAEVSGLDAELDDAMAEADPSGFFNTSSVQNESVVANRSASERLQQPKKIQPAEPFLTSLHIVSASGLDQAAIARLNQHLQAISLTTGIFGELAFEFQIVKGRVSHLVLDEQKSSLQNPEMIAEIRRSLLAWTFDRAVSGTIQLTLQIHT